MRARMFKPQFAAMVKAGTKRQTIRPVPKRMPKVGDLESWRQWSGRPYNSPQIELARVRLISVTAIKIYASHIDAWTGVGIEDFARADGFESFAEMAIWFQREHGLPFRGILIKAESVP
jgi:hypothetical protein